MNVPTVGRNLLGDDAYERMMARLEEGEHLIAVMATDESNYSFKGMAGYVAVSSTACRSCRATRPFSSMIET